MSDWHDEFAKAAADIQGYFGVSVTYTTRTGTSTSPTAMHVWIDVGALDDVQNATFSFRDTEIGTPELGDKITYNGSSWFVVKIRFREAGAWELRCQAPEMTA